MPALRPRPVARRREGRSGADARVPPVPARWNQIVRVCNQYLARPSAGRARGPSPGSTPAAGQAGRKTRPHKVSVQTMKPSPSIVSEHRTPRPAISLAKAPAFGEEMNPARVPPSGANRQLASGSES